MPRRAQPRRAIAAPSDEDVAKKAAASKQEDEEDEDDEEEIESQIGSGSLSGGGKLNPAGLPGGSGIVALPADEENTSAKKAPPNVDDTYASKMYARIMKANKERRTVTGVVLEPDTVDAHKDTIPADVILDAAEDFLANINIKTTMGLMHKNMKAPLELVQSFVVPDQDITINNVLVKKGSWVIVVRVNDDKIWQDVKDGKLTGFSIGGKAKVQSLKSQAVA